MPPLGGLDGIGHGSGRGATFGLNLADGSEPAGRESLLELAVKVM
jgi:hypothetical protein